MNRSLVWRWDYNDLRIKQRERVWGRERDKIWFVDYYTSLHSWYYVHSLDCSHTAYFLIQFIIVVFLKSYCSIRWPSGHSISITKLDFTFLFTVTRPVSRCQNWWSYWITASESIFPSSDSVLKDVPIFILLGFGHSMSLYSNNNFHGSPNK